MGYPDDSNTTITTPELQRMGTTHSQGMQEDLQQEFDPSQVIGFGPRVSSVYNHVMFEGWMIKDEYYASSEEEVFVILMEKYHVTRPYTKEDRDQLIEDLCNKGQIFWTHWYDEPPHDWWIPPTAERALQMVQQWANTNIESLWLEDLERTRNTVSADKLTEYIKTLIEVTQ